MPPRSVHGVVPPVCTPLTQDYEVDTHSLLRLVDHLLDAGVDGLFVLGSTSEVAFLPDRQRQCVMETVVKHVGGHVPILAGVIDMTTLRVLAHVGVATAAHCDGVVVTAPFYTRTHPVEIEAHFRMIADRSELPIYAYDLPGSVGSKFDNAMILRLASDGVIAGLKDSSGDDAGLRNLIVARKALGTLDQFSVLTGSELTVDSALRMGADGVVPGLGNVDPAGYVRLNRLCQKHDWDRALAEQERLIRLFDIVNVGSPARMGRGASALGAFKAALRLQGIIDDPRTAPPYVQLNDEEVERVRTLLVAAGLL